MDRNEQFHSLTAHPQIVCETCRFRPSELEVKEGVLKLDRANTGSCQIYRYPKIKPDNVYFYGAECERYEKKLE